jgi:uncharacterized membrane protein YphA (DoxX/SURF4 family)
MTSVLPQVLHDADLPGYWPFAVRFRVAPGGVFIAHGSQNLFGWFGGGGIEGTSKGMHAMGFRPAKPSALLACVG